MRTHANLLLPERSAPSTPPSGFVAGPYAKSDGLLYAKDDAGVETVLSGGGGGGGTSTIVIPEIATYAIVGAFTTSTVFPPFFVSEAYGTLALTRIRTKLTSGTATIKIRIAGTDEVTGITVTSTAATNDFTDEVTIADLDSIDIVCTAASSPVDLSATLFFERTITGIAGTGAVRVEDEGGSIVAAATGMNFAGPGVTVTDAGSNEALVTIPGVTVSASAPGSPATNDLWVDIS